MFFDNLGKVIFNNVIFEAATVRADVNRIKYFADARGLRSGITAVAVTRNEMLLYIIIAMIESNATFLPIDLSLPKDRVRYMLDNAKVSNILVSEEEQIGAYGDYNYILTNRATVIGEETDYNCCDCEPDYCNPAYVLYTSGTTGKPKGVEVTAKGFFNFINAIPDAVNIRKCKTAACFTSFSFDIFFLEAVLCLVNGITVVLADDEEQINPKKMLGLIRKYEIDCLQMTPSRMRLLLMCTGDGAEAEKTNFLQNVKVIMLGGEKLTDELLNKVKHMTKATVYNMYGPTETTIWSSVSDLTMKDKTDIGVPIKNTSIYCLDENGEQAAIGETGEIVIGGAGLANGYIGQPELTAKAFVTLPFEPYERVYRTGDMGYFDDAMVLHYEGRADSQVKLHGFRVELEEIEEAVNNIAGVEVSAVCFDSEADRLVCFYVAGTEKKENEIKLKLADVLPVYMIPSRLFRINELKYTVSGKLDRKALLKTLSHAESSGVEYYDDIEKSVMEVFWKNFSDSGIFSCDIRLSGIGIHSINYIQVIVELEEIFEIEFDEECLRIDYFETIGDIVKYIRDNIE